MKIGIFPMIAGQQGGGVETYELSLVQQLAALESPHQFHLFCLDQKTADAFGSLPENFRKQVVWPGRRIPAYFLGLPLAIRHSGVDLVHATFVPPWASPRPVVLTMHDICMHTHPELYPRRIRRRFGRLVFRRLGKMNRLVCISETTRSQTVQHFSIPRGRTSVVPLGVDERFRPASNDTIEVTLRRLGIPQDYILYAGNLRVGGKNLVRILEAFRLLLDRCQRPITLVFTGRRSWGVSELDATIERLELGSSIRYTGWLSPEDVPVMYSGARLLIFPSLCEGFGLPALEAMACGTPVVTSRLSCMPEITGNAAYLVDPLSVPEIATGMQRLLEDEDLHQSLRKKGLLHVRQYTWSRTAQETMAIYDLCGGS
ncbi:MAG: glycosyltransferase family 1 protein [Pirellulaceae bacterium]